jgi:8-oxo-dGTP pyrophosphatase MutT (NUDIX family)
MIFNWEEFNEGGYWGDEASGILPICRETGRICIGLRASWVNQPLTWGNFGGAIGLSHEGEQIERLSPNDNAIEEFKEETGYDGDIEMYPSYVFERDNFKYYNFIGVVENEFELNLSGMEHIEVLQIKWVTFDELLSQDKLHTGLSEMIKQSGDQIQDTISKL